MIDRRVGLLAGMFIFLLILENFWPLRNATQMKVTRVLVNLALAGVGALSMRFVFFPLVLLVSQWGETKQVGLSH